MIIRSLHARGYLRSCFRRPLSIPFPSLQLLSTRMELIRHFMIRAISRSPLVSQRIHGRSYSSTVAHSSPILSLNESGGIMKSLMSQSTRGTAIENRSWFIEWRWVVNFRGWVLRRQLRCISLHIKSDWFFDSSE